MDLKFYIQKEDGNKPIKVEESLKVNFRNIKHDKDLHSELTEPSIKKFKQRIRRKSDLNVKHYLITEITEPFEDEEEVVLDTQKHELLSV